MFNKLILSILLFLLCACGGGSDSNPSDNTSTNDIVNTDVNSDDSNQNSVNSTPTEPGFVCRNDESYYPLPANYEYRKPEASNAVEYSKKRITIEAATGAELENLEYKSYSVFYSISDLNNITPSIAPPFNPSSDWGSIWSAENLISSVTQDDNSAENTTNFRLYPNDGTVKLIKSDNKVHAEYDSSRNFWLWGETILPKLETFTTFTKTSNEYKIDQDTQRWNKTVNFSVNNTSIIMTGIGCIESFVVQSNETSVMDYDDGIDDILDDGPKKYIVDRTFYVHPTIGIVHHNGYLEIFDDQDSSSEIAYANQSDILTDINFYSELPDIVNR